MKSRERILGVIAGKIPDRVPVCLFIKDEGNFLRQVYPDLDYGNILECKYRLIDLERELGLDLFIRLLHGIYPDWIIYGGVNTETETEKWEVSTDEIKEAHSIIKQTVIRTPAGVLEQEFTVSESVDMPGTYGYACSKKPIKTEKDLDILVNFEPSMSPSFPANVRKLITKVKQYLQDDGVLTVWVPGAAFNHASLLIEPSNLYRLFLLDRCFYDKLMNYCMKRTLPFLKALAESGIDIFCMGGNMSGGYIGHTNYETYVLPFDKRYIANVRKLGVRALYHNSCQIMALAESYIKLESDIIEPFAPPPLGDGDLKRAKEISQGSYTIIGNVDQVNVLKKGSLDEVKRVTRETVETGKDGGRYILQTADCLEYGTPMENIRAFVETGLQYGEYSC